MATILVIDDEADMRRVIGRALMAAGHRVIEARDGSNALELVRAHQPALVITDIVMPGQEGIETICELRRDAPALPILAISGDGRGPIGVSYLDMAMKLGATAVLPKPFLGAELVALVESLLLAASVPLESAQ